MHYIYIIQNIVNSKIYVGQTKDPAQRWRQHKAMARRPNDKRAQSPLYHSMRKHGLDNFTFEVVAVFTSAEDADAHEINLIAALKTTQSEVGYNLAPGGLVNRHSAETRDKQRAKRLQAIERNVERYGAKMSPDQRIKLREANIGKKQSEESKQKKSAATKGIPRGPMTEATKQKISEANKGSPPTSGCFKPGLIPHNKSSIWEHVEEIVDATRSGETQASVALRFGVSQATIWNVLHKQRIS